MVVEELAPLEFGSHVGDVERAAARFQNAAVASIFG